MKIMFNQIYFGTLVLLIFTNMNTCHDVETKLDLEYSLSKKSDVYNSERNVFNKYYYEKSDNSDRKSKFDVQTKKILCKSKNDVMQEFESKGTKLMQTILSLLGNSNNTKKDQIMRNYKTGNDIFNMNDNIEEKQVIKTKANNQRNIFDNIKLEQQVPIDLYLNNSQAIQNRSSHELYEENNNNPNSRPTLESILVTFKNTLSRAIPNTNRRGTTVNSSFAYLNGGYTPYSILDSKLKQNYEMESVHRRVKRQCGGAYTVFPFFVFLIGAFSAASSAVSAINSRKKRSNRVENLLLQELLHGDRLDVDFSDVQH